MESFQSSAATLLKECFEGIPAGQDFTWFVQGSEGIFDALDSLDSEAASTRHGRVASVAAHANHILYSLKSANAWFGGEEPEGSWEDSWQVQTCERDSWNRIRTDIRSEYEKLLLAMQSNQDWGAEDMIIGVLSTLPHMAFHLGAIRQLILM